MAESKRDFNADKRTCDAATVGPWIKYASGGDKEAQVFNATDTFPIATFGFTNEDEDATFIAEARTGWPAALEHIRAQDAEIERLRADNERLRKAERHTYVDAFTAGMCEYAFELMSGKTPEEIGEQIAQMISRKKEMHASIDGEEALRNG